MLAKGNRSAVDNGREGDKESGMVLSDAPAGVSFRVKGVLAGRVVGKRLSDRRVIRKTHGPIEACVLDYDGLIRRMEAAGIQAESSVNRARFRGWTGRRGDGAIGKMAQMAKTEKK